MKTKAEILEVLNKPKFTQKEVDDFVNDATERLYKAAIEGKRAVSYHVSLKPEGFITEAITKLSELGFTALYETTNTYHATCGSITNFTVSIDDIVTQLRNSRIESMSKYDYGTPLFKFNYKI